MVGRSPRTVSQRRPSAPLYIIPTHMSWADGSDVKCSPAQLWSRPGCTRQPVMAALYDSALIIPPTYRCTSNPPRMRCVSGPPFRPKWRSPHAGLSRTESRSKRVCGCWEARPAPHGAVGGPACSSQASRAARWEASASLCPNLFRLLLINYRK